MECLRKLLACSAVDVLGDDCSSLIMLQAILVALGYVIAAAFAAFTAVLVYYAIRTTLQSYRLRNIPEPPASSLLMGHFNEVS